MVEYLDTLKAQFNDRVRLKAKRPGVMQLLAPLYHEDGDMLDIFIEPSPGTEGATEDVLRVCDHGMTLMRLSYAYEIDTPTREKVLARILSENGVREQQGNLLIDTDTAGLGPAVLQFAQTVARVSSMRAYKREVVQSLFFEQLREVVQTRLSKYSPEPNFLPLPDHDEYEVDYRFNHRPKQVYLFGVNNQANARLATIALQEFVIKRLNFWGAIVLEDLDNLGRKDRTRLLSAADKIFPTLDDFANKGAQFLEREGA